MALAAMFACEY